MDVPYEGATSGMKARDEIVRILQRCGCASVGFMDLFEEKALLLAFTHRGRQVQLKASAKGWAQLYLRAHPYNRTRMRLPRDQYEKRALDQGMIAVNSILRDWIKGQITAVECGILSFEAVFFPHMIGTDGRPLLEVAMAALPPPTEGN